MKMLYIMCGVAFAGKTTLAKAIAQAKGAELVSLDVIWFEKEKEMNEEWTDSQEWAFVKAIGLERVSLLLAAGKSVVYDSVNTKRQHRDEARGIAASHDASAVVVFLDTPEEEQERRRVRNKETKDRHDVKQEHIDAARRNLERPGTDEGTIVFAPDTDLTSFLLKLP